MRRSLRPLILTRPGEGGVGRGLGWDVLSLDGVGVGVGLDWLWFGRVVLGLIELGWGWMGCCGLRWVGLWLGWVRLLLF